jgi:NTP pyrophosphatase (non-canonical NTP hydrolase)
MPDHTTTVAELRDLLRTFVRERDWEQFHAPKNLSMALAIEAAELMEHFQWISVEASRTLRDHSEELAAVGEELADVVCYALALANELNLDLSDTVQAKILKNAQKYPVDQIRGRYGHDDPRPSIL